MTDLKKALHTAVGGVKHGAAARWILKEFASADELAATAMDVLEERAGMPVTIQAKHVFARAECAHLSGRGSSSTAG